MGDLDGRQIAHIAHIAQVANESGRERVGDLAAPSQSLLVAAVNGRSVSNTLIAGAGAVVPPGAIAVLTSALEILAQLGLKVIRADAPPAAPQLVDVSAAADALGVSRWSLYRWAAARKIPAVRTGRLLRFVVADVAAALHVNPIATPAQQDRQSAATRRELPRGRRRMRRALSGRASTRPATPAPVDPAERLRVAAALSRVLGD